MKKKVFDSKIKCVCFKGVARKSGALLRFAPLFFLFANFHSPKMSTLSLIIFGHSLRLVNAICAIVFTALSFYVWSNLNLDATVNQNLMDGVANLQRLNGNYLTSTGMTLSIVQDSVERYQSLPSQAMAVAIAAAAVAIWNVLALFGNFWKLHRSFIYFLSHFFLDFCAAGVTAAFVIIFMINLEELNQIIVRYTFGYGGFRWPTLYVSTAFAGLCTVLSLMLMLTHLLAHMRVSRQPKRVTSCDISHWRIATNSETSATPDLPLNDSPNVTLTESPELPVQHQPAPLL